MNQKIKDYSILLSESLKKNQRIWYVDLLATKEWQIKRTEIINRDNNKCNNCLKQGSIIINSQAYRYKTNDELEIDRIERDRIYEESTPHIIDLLRAMLPLGSPIPTLPKAEIELTVRDFEPIFLHVHHKYYITNTLPWDYDSEALVTLCPTCHQKVHDEFEIPIYKDKKLNDRLNYTNCSRCRGSGYIEKYHYHMDGICFQCNGEKYNELA